MVNPTFPKPPAVITTVTFLSRHSKNSQGAGSQQPRTSDYCQRKTSRLPEATHNRALKQHMHGS